MKKTVVFYLLILLLSITTYKSNAQHYALSWDQASHDTLLNNIKSIFESDKINFSDIKGDFVKNDDDMEYYNSKQKLGPFTTYIVKTSDTTWVFSGIYYTTAFTDDLDKIKLLFKDLHYQMSDSRDTNDANLPDGCSRRLMAGNDDNADTRYIVASLFFNPTSSYLSILIKK